METSLFLANLTSPPLLFFLLGAASALFRTDLEIPEAVARLLSLYLLMAIGFKGGVALSTSSLGFAELKGLLLAILMSVVVPIAVFYLLKGRLGPANAAATAATYGSISAVTFVTATSYLDTAGVDWSGYLVAAMALMESPAIIIGLLLYRLYSTDEGAGFRARELLRESLLNGSVFLIVGSLVVGWISGPAGKDQVSVFIEGIFIGVLCLFLLDMGIVAMRRFEDMVRSDGGPSIPLLLVSGLVFPLTSALAALGLSFVFGLPEGDAVLLVVLSASASYIAVPAAMRLALPEANPSIYLTLSLAVTFPFNLLVGIPMYHQAVQWIGLS